MPGSRHTPYAHCHPLLWLGTVVLGLGLTLPLSGQTIEVDGESSSARPAVQPREQLTEANPATFGWVDRARHVVGLRTSDMAAMGMDAARSQKVLTALSDWALQRQPQLDALRVDLFNAERDRQAVMRSVHTGSAPAGWRRDLEAADNRLASLESTRRQLFDEAASAADRWMNAEQVRMRQNARQNKGVHGPARYLELDPAIAPRVAGGNLNASQRQAIDTYEQRIREFYDRVAQAERDTLYLSATPPSNEPTPSPGLTPGSTSEPTPQTSP